MSCINKGSKEYKDLLRRSGVDNATLDMAIINYQTEYGTDEFPTVKSVKDFSNSVGHIQRVVEKGDVTSSNIMSPVEFETFRNTITNLVSTTTAKIGMTGVIVNNPNILRKGWVSEGVAYVNLAYCTEDTPIHEVLGHPIISNIKKNNPKFYANLLKELESGIGKEVYDRIVKTYTTESNSDPYLKEEAIVELIGLMTTRKLNEAKEKGLIATLRRVVERIKRAVRNLLNLNEVNIESLPNNLTVNDLSNLLARQDSKIIQGDKSQKASFESEFHEQKAAQPKLNNTTGAFNNYFQQVADNLTFYPDDHKFEYTDPITGKVTEFSSVSAAGTKNGFGGMDEETSKKYAINSQAGTMVHAVIAEYLLKKHGKGKQMLSSEQFPITSSAKRHIEQLVDLLIGKGITILGVEQNIMDVESNTAGIIDLLVRDSSGEVYMLDFKTKFVYEALDNVWFEANGFTYKLDKKNNLYTKTDGNGDAKDITEAEFNNAKASANTVYNAKERSKYNPWAWYRAFGKDKDGKVSKDKRKVEMNKHNFQQSMYQAILAKNGLKVHDKYIVPLEIVMLQDVNNPDNFKIGDVNISKAINTDAQGRVNLPTTEFIEDTVNVALGGESIYNTEYKKTAAKQMEEIASDLMGILATRAAKLAQIGRRTSANLLRGDIFAIDQTSDTFTILGAINTAAKQLNYIYASYQDMHAREKQEIDKTSIGYQALLNTGINPLIIDHIIQEHRKLLKDYTTIPPVSVIEARAKLKMYDVSDEELQSMVDANNSVSWDLTKLKHWNDFAKSFAILDDVLVYVSQNPEAFERHLNEKEFNDFLNLLKDVVSQRREVESLYDTKGKEAYIKLIQDHVTYTEAKLRDTLEIEYRKNFHKDPDNKGKKVDEDVMSLYIEDEVRKAMESGDLSREKIENIKTLILSKDKDISKIGSLVSSIFQSSEVLVGAVLKKYEEEMQVARLEFVSTYKELMDLVKEYEEVHPTHDLKDQKEVWGMLVDDTGEVLGLVDEVPRSYVEARDDEFATINENASKTNAEKHIARKKWLDDNAPIPLNKTKVVQDTIIEMYEQSYEAGDITKTQLELLIEGIKSTSKVKYPNTLAFDGSLDKTVANNLQEKLADIEDSYRIVDEKKYPNPKYKALIGKDPNSIDSRIWNFLRSLHEQGDAFVPVRYQLDGRLPGMTDKSVTSKLKAIVNHLSDETEGYGMYEYASEANEKINVVPIKFVGKVDKTKQSYDLPTIFKEWYKSVLNYHHTMNVLPELEYTQHVLRNRETAETRGGNRIFNVLQNRWNVRNPSIQVEEKQIVKKPGESNISNQFNTWMKMVVYGDKYNEDAGTKVMKYLNQYTSLRVMAMNLYATVANVAVGEFNQMTEVLANKHMSAKSYTKSNALVIKDLVNVMGDVASRNTESLTLLLMDRFSIEHSVGDGDVKDITKAKRLMSQSTLYFGMKMGEFILRSRFMYGLLLDTRVVDQKTGTDYGNLLENMSVANGKLQLSVNARKYFSAAQEARIRRKLQIIMMEMHGNYTPMMQSSLQANAYSASLEVFRKWIVPGVERRYSNKFYHEYAEEYKVGSYNAGYKHLKRNAKYRYNQIMQFFGKMSEEATMLELYANSRLDSLPEYEQEAIKKAKIEVIIWASLLLLIQALSAIEDDDDKHDGWWYNQLAYQLERVRMEMMFWVNPVDQLNIIKSPIAGSSTISDTLSVLGQVFDIMSLGDEMKTGPWKGHNKYMIKLLKTSPLTRQVLRAMEPGEQRKALTLF